MDIAEKENQIDSEILEFMNELEDKFREFTENKNYLNKLNLEIRKFEEKLSIFNFILLHVKFFHCWLLFFFQLMSSHFETKIRPFIFIPASFNLEWLII